MAQTLARADSYRAGKDLRSATPRKAHAALDLDAGRDPVALLAETDANRVAQLVPERYARMMASPFAFLRGAAAVMASDLAGLPVAGVPVQSGGDCHLMNFGAFVTPEDNILFDINDFDETLPGIDFTVDLKRLAASVAVAADAADLGKSVARSLAASCIKAYRERMFELAELSPLEIWHSRIDLTVELQALQNRDLKRQLASIIAKAQGSGLEADDNFPHLVSGSEPQILDKPPTIFHIDAKADAKDFVDLDQVFAAYRTQLSPEKLKLLDRYTLRDVAFKAVGVGSVGTFCAIGLFMSADGEPLFLQVKEAQTSVLERLSKTAGLTGNQGQRVIEGQRMMQSASDIFLGAAEDVHSGRHFYVRRLKNRRLGAISEIGEEDSLGEYARLCGRTLARSHARSGEPAIMAGYMGRGSGFDEAIAAFALAYAGVTKSDHAALVAAKAPPHKDGHGARSKSKGASSKDT